MTMRLEADQEAYEYDQVNGKLRPINKEPALQTFKYWRLVENRYPHTRISDVNDMLVLNREATSLKCLTACELAELIEIIDRLKNAYDCTLFNLANMSSVKNIPHFHLYKLKRSLK